MTGAEAAGELVTGALVAGAVEGRSGERRGQGVHGTLCLNCGTALLGSYCHRCGQAEHVHRSLSAIWHDIAHGVLHFEGKIWNTLPLLAWRPGELTRRYIHGERARFVSPMALFLFSVFLMFALFTAIGGNLTMPADGQGAAAFQIDRSDIDQELKRIDQAIVKAREAGKNTAELERERKAVVGLTNIVTAGPRGRSARETLNINTGVKSIDEALKKAEANPNLVLYKLQSNAYKFSWALIPISTPFLWLLFAWRRRFRLYDHAVFVTYSLSFMSLLVIALTVLGFIGLPTGLIVVAALLLPPWHMYRQLRGAYEIGRASAAIRSFALVVFSGWVLGFYAVMLLTLGVMA